MSLVILRCCVDTLEVSLQGKLSDGLEAELDRLKVAAQDAGIPQLFADSRLCVEDKAFGMWRWRLTCADYAIMLARPSAASKHIPNGRIRFSAFGLSTRKHSELVAEALEQLKLLGDYFERNVARLDVCVDVQGWMPTYDEMLGVSCPAAYRGLHLNGNTVQTFQYGKGDVVVRVYDKTAEIAHSHKTWMRGVWGVCDGYEPGEPVTRIEVQIKTKALSELAISTVAQAFEHAGDALSWALGEWCNLRVPNGDKKVTRWPEHPIWTEVRHALPSSRHLERVRAKCQLMLVEEAAKRLPGLAAVVGATYLEDNYIKCVQALSDLAEIRMNEDDIVFADLVAAKRKRLEAELGWDADVPF